MVDFKEKGVDWFIPSGKEMILTIFDDITIPVDPFPISIPRLTSEVGISFYFSLVKEISRLVVGSSTLMQPFLATNQLHFTVFVKAKKICTIKIDREELINADSASMRILVDKIIEKLSSSLNNPKERKNKPTKQKATKLIGLGIRKF